jgi:hypothetical protein
MFIRDEVWLKIRLRFSEQEKLELRAAVTGEVICPRGFMIEHGDLDVDLRRKLDTAMEDVR